MFLTPDDWALLASQVGTTGLSGLKALGLVELRPQPHAHGSFWRPALRFRRLPLRQCPFLVNDLGDEGLSGLCSLHPNKPLVCRLAPLSRTVETVGEVETERWEVVAPVEGCPGMGQGDPLEAARPAELSERLDREAKWVRTCLAAPELSTPEGAWEYYLSRDNPV